ncbi:hypothetical protein A2U01_0105446, partial [Trifolium medium]|nr:hypothetical protein [Trifolium medium]
DGATLVTLGAHVCRGGSSVV